MGKENAWGHVLTLKSLDKTFIYVVQDFGLDGPGSIVYAGDSVMKAKEYYKPYNPVEITIWKKGRKRARLDYNDGVWKIVDQL